MIKFLLALMLTVLFVACSASVDSGEIPAPNQTAPAVLQGDGSMICNVNTDCAIYKNNYNQVTPCDVDNTSCIAQATARVSGPPGHGERPNPEELVAVCKAGTCDVAYNCTLCPQLKARFEFCKNYQGGTSSGLCALYAECKC